MKNVQKINRIEFTRTVYPFCPMGNDNYEAEVSVEIYPGEDLFDFIEVDKAIKALSKESLIVEELVARVYEIMLQFSPVYLVVSANAKSNGHFPVKVTKTMKPVDID